MRSTIVVALSIRQWDNLKAATHTQAAFDELTAKLGVRLSLEGERFKHRHAITAVLKPFFDAHRIQDFAKAFEEHGVTWSKYRTFKECVEQDPDCSTDNPMFSIVDHPGIGSYLTPGNPIAFSNVERVLPGIAPRLGENTDEILTEIGYTDGDIASLRDDRIVGGRPDGICGPSDPQSPAADLTACAVRRAASSRMGVRPWTHCAARPIIPAGGPKAANWSDSERPKPKKPSAASAARSSSKASAPIVRLQYAPRALKGGPASPPATMAVKTLPPGGRDGGRRLFRKRPRANGY